MEDFPGEQNTIPTDHCRTVAALARVVIAMGYRAAVEGHTITLGLPGGHVSWRFAEHDKYLFDYLPRVHIEPQLDYDVVANRLESFLTGVKFWQDYDSRGYFRANKKAG